jgi:hypothetical protein
VRVWVDLTNSPHAVVLAPLVRVLRERGHAVEVTARAYAQTVELATRLGLDPVVVGAHGGAGRAGKARAAAARVVALGRFARGRGFDVALGHGSTEQPAVARLLSIRCGTLHDYEFARGQHALNCRFATRVFVPDVIPAQRFARYGARPPKLVPYPGIKEEYALADLEPDPAVAAGFARGRVLVVLRPPAELALYHRFANPLFDEVLRTLAGRDDVATVVLARTPEQGARLRALGLRGVDVPAEAVDGPSLVAGADLVVSAGGTMNREAAVLGTPVYTTFAGELGGVDEWLIATGRLRPLRRVADLRVERKVAGALPRLRRSPAALVDLVLDRLGVGS